MTVWEQVKDRNVGDAWTTHELAESFDMIAGAVAYPGRRPGFAVVAGLRPVHRKDVYEIHVVDEFESPDLQALLGRCHGMIRQYRIPAMKDEPFPWYGDALNMAAVRIIDTVNEQGQPFSSRRSTRDDLYVVTSRIQEMGQAAYPYLTSTLRHCMGQTIKQLFLHDSRAVHSLNEIQADQIADLRLGDYPAVEALGCVVIELRAFAEQSLEDRLNPPQETKPYNPGDFV